MIPYGRQQIDENDIASVVDVLHSDWLTTGPKVTEFEEAVARFVGAFHGVAVSSGTAGLHSGRAADRGRPGRRLPCPGRIHAAPGGRRHRGSRRAAPRCAAPPRRPA